MLVETYALTSSGVNYSTDNGVTWNLQSVVDQVTRFSEVYASPFVQHTVFISGRSAVGIQYSLNAGVTFTQATGVYDLLDRYLQIQSPSQSIIYAVGQKNIIKSTDGGYTFSNLALTEDLYGDSSALGRSIYFYTNLAGYVAINEKIYVTSNGGTSWTEYTSSFASDEIITDIKTKSDGSLLYVATSLGFYSSTASGSWTTLTVFPTPGTSSFDLISDTEIQLASYSTPYVASKIQISTNSGNTWTEHYLPLGSGIGTFTDTIGYNINSFLTCVYTSIILSSTDGGSTTNQVLIGKPLALSKATFTICYKITDCNDPEFVVYSDTDLSASVNRVIKCEEYPNRCLFLEVSSSTNCPDPSTITITDEYDTCQVCAPSFKLYNCDNPENILYTEDATFSAYVQPSKVVRLLEYPYTCWQVGINYDQDYVPETLTVDGDAYVTCDTCIPKYFILTRCSDQSIVYANYTDDLFQSNGLVASILYDDYTTCYSVEQAIGFTEDVLVDVTVVTGKFLDCSCCNGPAPEPEPVFVRTTQKPVKDFTRITESECQVKTIEKFAVNYYNYFRELKYGFQNCCGDHDLDKLWMEMQMVTFSKMQNGTCTP
jgi:photosystem II stability/assembly factor-like uncharacterized protein